MTRRRERKDTEAMEPEERSVSGNGLKLWKSPAPYVRPKDTDPCGEWLPEVQGFCMKTVAEHRREFLEFGRKIAARAVRW